jgi:excisionase family DNA binding protein
MLAYYASMRNETHATADSGCLAIPAEQVAKLLGVSKRHVAALNASGRLPRPVRLGRSVRWRADELRDWLEAGAPSRDRWEALRNGGAK